MIACLGSPMIDIIADVDDGFLIDFDLKPDSAYAADSRSNKLFSKLASMNSRHVVGGSVTNSVRVISWVTKKLNSVVYIGAVGYDYHGKLIAEKLSQENITCAFKYLENAETAKCGVLLENLRRTLYTELGASKLLNLNHIKEINIWKYIEKSSFIYLSAFFLGVSWECIKEVIKISNEKKIIFNLGAPFICEKYPYQILEIISNVDILFGNEAELISLAKILELHSDNLHQTALTINGYKNLKNRIMIITRASKPAILVKCGKIEEFPSIFVPKVVDTNGAGDAFVGGFLAKYIEGCDLYECMRCAMWTAGEIIQNVGCSFDSNKVYV